MEEITQQKSRLFKAGFVLVVLLSALIATKIITEVKGFQFIGGATPATNVVSFDGKGEVSAKPDLATVSFTISETEKDMKSAQDKVTAKEAAAITMLTKSGIDKKDIKTDSYNSYPKYDYREAVCNPTPIPMMKNAGNTGIAMPTTPVYCPPGKQVLTGYEVSEYITVKIHDLAKAGDILTGLGNVGVSGVSGPNFSIENEDALKAQARKMAIDEAKEKAQVLAKDLGVNLVRIVNFSENGNYPMMYAGKGMMADSVSSAPAQAPELPTGENKITSNVTITYEIR